MSEPEQHIVARLPASLVRRARSLTGPGRPYEDLAELIEVSVLNQLALEGGASDVRLTSGTGDGLEDRLLTLRALPPQLLPTDHRSDPLSSFTNRLFPVKLSCRVLSNCAENEELADFQRKAAEVARAIGLRLREEDKGAQRRGMDRRWVALPVGAKGDSTMNRFINHFTLTPARDGKATGPLPLLGLAGLDRDGRPLLTELGWELAREPNPVLDQESAGAATLDEQERNLLVHAIRANTAESGSIRAFADMVHGAEGLQSRVDSELMKTHDWSHDQAAAHRASVIGRLHDLGLADVDGEGADARIHLAADLATQLQRDGDER